MFGKPREPLPLLSGLRNTYKYNLNFCLQICQLKEQFSAWFSTDFRMVYHDKTLVRLNLSIYTEMKPALDFSASDTVVTE